MCLGIPGKIVEIMDASRMLAKVDISGIKRPVNIACVVGEDMPLEQCVGSWVLVHVGFAMSLIDEEEAQKTLALLAEMDDANDEIEAIRTSGQNTGSLT